MAKRCRCKTVNPITSFNNFSFGFNKIQSGAGCSTPIAPSNLTATTVSDTQINLAWTDNSDNETGFSIERSTDGINFSEIDTVAANIVVYNDTGLTAVTQYWYRVRAFQDTCYSDYSNTANDTTDTAPLLLDAYPNAAYAYDLRLLRAAYAGASIRVREDNTNTEADIGFVAIPDGDGNYALDTTALLAHCGVHSGFITKVYDQSGNSLDLQQPTSTSQPRIVSSGVVDLENAKAAIDMLTSKQIFAADNALFRPSVLSLFTVNKTTKATRADLILCGNEAAFATVNYVIGTNSTVLTSMFPRTPAAQQTGAKTNAQNLFSVIADNATTTLNFWSNDTLSVNNSSLTIGTDDTTGFRISGGTADFQGTWQCIVAWGSDQSANRTGIQNNIDTYYNVLP